jgi:hypothetical protein
MRSIPEFKLKKLCEHAQIHHAFPFTPYTIPPLPIVPLIGTFYNIIYQQSIIFKILYGLNYFLYKNNNYLDKSMQFKKILIPPYTIPHPPYTMEWEVYNVGAWCI